VTCHLIFKKISLRVVIILILLAPSAKFYSQDIYQFYAKRNTCELLICDENFKQASECYESLFSEHQVFNISDAHNYLITNILRGDIEKISLSVSRLEKFDLDTSYINLIKSKYGINIRKTDNVSKESLSINNAFKRLNILDQSIRNHCREEYGDYYAVCGEEIKLLDSLIYDQFILLIENGFPNDLLVKNTGPHHDLLYHLIIIHNSQWHRFVETEKYIENIELGNIDPESVCYFLDKLKQEQYGTAYNIKLRDDLYLFKLNENIRLLNEINKRRIAIGASSLEDLHRKIIYQETVNSDFELIPYFIAGVTFNADQETLNILQEKWKDSKVKVIEK
jgi:hypothetical protein